MWQMKLKMKRGQTRKVPEHEAKETQTFFWEQQGSSKHLRMVTRYLASPRVEVEGGQKDGAGEEAGEGVLWGRLRGGDDRGRD